MKNMTQLGVEKHIFYLPCILTVKGFVTEGDWVLKQYEDITSRCLL